MEAYTSEDLGTTGYELNLSLDSILQDMDVVRQIGLILPTALAEMVINQNSSQHHTVGGSIGISGGGDNSAEALGKE